MTCVLDAERLVLGTLYCHWKHLKLKVDYLPDVTAEPQRYEEYIEATLRVLQRLIDKLLLHPTIAPVIHIVKARMINKQCQLHGAV